MRFTVFRFEGIRDYILTAVLLVIALLFMVSSHNGGLNNIRKISFVTFSYLEEPLANIRVYREALKTNDRLRRQNVLLMDELSRLRSVKTQNESLKRMLGFKDTTKLNLIPVKVIGKDLTGMNNMLTVDVGTVDSVSVGMPLITPEGLVGQIIATSRHYSEVMPFSNMMFRVSSQIQGKRAYGIVSWDGHSPQRLEMLFVPKTVRVDTGMVVETSGDGNEYPSNIPIGKVTGKHFEKGKETQIIYLKPFVSLSTLAEGFIVRFRPDSAVSRLQTKIQGLFQ